MVAKLLEMILLGKASYMKWSWIENVLLLWRTNDNYYCNPDDETVWGHRRKTSALKQLTPRTASSSYTFRDNTGQRYSFTVTDVKDLIAYPTIQANDLITKDDIIERRGLLRSIWDNRKLSRLFPYSTRHKRYDGAGKKVSGWSRDYVNSISKQSITIRIENKWKGVSRGFLRFTPLL